MSEFCLNALMAEGSFGVKGASGVECIGRRASFLTVSFKDGKLQEHYGTEKSWKEDITSIKEPYGNSKI